MQEFGIVIVLLSFALTIALVAKRFDFPYPVALLLGGFAYASFPEVPRVRIAPEVIFYVLLPPILTEAAFFTSWRDFWKWRRSILLLAFGLVSVTSAAVAAICVYMIPGMTWAQGFVLGAIVSPPDAAAATSILRSVRLPRRIVQILEGESLVNDAAALTLYRFAVAAVLTGTFSFSDASLAFLWISIGGGAIGAGLGFLSVKIFPLLRDPQVEILFTFVLSYASYSLAEAVHCSGVLSTVTAGMILGSYSPQLFNATTRIRSKAVWETAIALINVTVFLLIGLEIPFVFSSLKEYSSYDLALWGGAISLGVIAIRWLWVFPATYLPRMLFASVREKEAEPAWQSVSVVAWTGLRGVVSVASAQALPQMTAAGPFPHRDLMLFLTFAVIVSTLVAQGLSLRSLIRWLKVPEDRSSEQDHLHATLFIAEEAMKKLEDLENAGHAPANVLARVRGYLEDSTTEIRVELESEMQGPRKTRPEHFQNIAEQRVWWELVQVQRHALLQLLHEGRIGYEAIRRIEEDIDLLEARIVPS